MALFVLCGLKAARGRVVPLWVVGHIDEVAHVRAGIHVRDDSQIQPALVGPDVGDFGDPG